MPLLFRVLRLRDHYGKQRQRGVDAGDRHGVAVLDRMLVDFDTAVQLTTGETMKLDLGKILTIAALVQSAVSSAQDKLKGKKGAEKKAAVIEVVKDAVPFLEGVAGKDLVDDEKVNDTISSLVDAEALVLKLRAQLAELVADIKAKNAKPTDPAGPSTGD